jgi:hypothetical protein
MLCASDARRVVLALGSGLRGELRAAIMDALGGQELGEIPGVHLQLRPEPGGR